MISLSFQVSQVEEVLEFQAEASPQEVTVVQQQLPHLLPDRIGFIGAGQVYASCQQTHSLWTLLTSAMWNILHTSCKLMHSLFPCPACGGNVLKCSESC